MVYRKSSYSDAETCIEVDTFRKSSYTYANNWCVEVAQGKKVVGVRDSQDKTGPVLEFGDDTWTKFVASLV